jgi:NitT/TauT family transport system ATP-binding protein
MAKIIEIRDVTKQFAGNSGGHQSVVALTKLNLDMEGGEFLAVMGPSGCGKSTLLNIIAGFDSPDAGTCKVNGRNVTSAGPDRGVVFQEYALFPWMTVERNVTFAMQAAGKWSDKAPDSIAKILTDMGLMGFRQAFPKALSGGMRQRVAIARVLAIDAPVMLMDEPYGALDALTRASLQEELVTLWQRTRKSIFFVTHNVDEAIYLADRVVVMTPRPGRIVLEVKVDLPRPRDVTQVRFNEYTREILSVIHPPMRASAAGHDMGSSQ